MLSRYIECVRAGPALLQKAQLLYSEVGCGRLNQMRKQALSEVVKRNQEQSHTRMLRKITGVTSLTKEEVHRLHDAFDLKRKRNTMTFGAETPWEERVIDFSGFEELMRHEMPQFNGDAEMLKNLFNAFDDDRSGFVDEQEFIVGLSTLIASADVEDSANTDAKLRMCFQTADSSNDGRVGREELVKLLESCHKLVSRNAGERPRPAAVAAGAGAGARPRLQRTVSLAPVTKVQVQEQVDDLFEQIGGASALLGHSLVPEGDLGWGVAQMRRR